MDTRTPFRCHRKILSWRSWYGYHLFAIPGLDKAKPDDGVREEFAGSTERRESGIGRTEELGRSVIMASRLKGLRLAEKKKIIIAINVIKRETRPKLLCRNVLRLIYTFVYVFTEVI